MQRKTHIGKNIYRERHNPYIKGDIPRGGYIRRMTHTEGIQKQKGIYTEKNI